MANSYYRRWKVETCFKHMKSNGFQLKKITFEDGHKAKLLVAILMFAYTLSILEGLKECEKVPNKKYQNGTQYKSISDFRKGIDSIISQCIHIKKFMKYILTQIDHAKNAYKNPKAIFV